MAVLTSLLGTLHHECSCQCVLTLAKGGQFSCGGHVDLRLFVTLAKLSSEHKLTVHFYHNDSVRYESTVPQRFVSSCKKLLKFQLQISE
jgi:hypothetical protein